MQFNLSTEDNRLTSITYFEIDQPEFTLKFEFALKSSPRKLQPAPHYFEIYNFPSEKHEPIVMTNRIRFRANGNSLMFLKAKKPNVERDPLI